MKGLQLVTDNDLRVEARRRGYELHRLLHGQGADWLVSTRLPRARPALLNLIRYRGNRCLLAI